MIKIQFATKNLTIILISLILLYCTALHADPGIASNNFPTELLMGNFNSNSKVERLSIAQKLLKIMTQLNFLLPHLTVPGKETLKYQMQSIQNDLNQLKKNGPDNFNYKKYSDDWMAYYNNPDLEHSSLEMRINNVINNLNCIINSQDINLEMYCWTKVSELFLNQTVWKNSIEELVNQNQFVDVQFWPSFNKENNIKLSYKMFSSFGKSVLDYIVLPYLNNLIPKKFRVNN